MYLKEIQGLRTVAALLVAIYHIWFHRVSGGVDAFFVISGFFLYRTLLAHGIPGWTAILLYWRRTFARIFPSTSIVILATSGLFFWLGADSLWQTQIKSGIASLFFVENWRLWLNGADYLTQDQLPSPFQQMWALSVQMQIYLGLPIVFVAIAWTLRLFGNATMQVKSFAGIALLITAVSFAYALVATYVDQPSAYFDTAARVWEFSAGCFLAASLSRLTVPAPYARILGYVSLAILVSFAAVIPVGQSFPGVAALVPVLATAGIIVAAANGGDIALLNNRPMQWLGDMSFTFYLWHWPLLMAWRLSSGTIDVSLAAGLMIIASAFVLSWITLVLAERPFRSSKIATTRVGVAFLACALVMAPAFAAVGLWGLEYVARQSQAQTALTAFLHGEVSNDIVPATVIAKTDVPVAYRDKCHQRFNQSEVIECVYGNADGSFAIALVGGSHSLQWLPALQRLARDDNSMKIIVMTKSACPLTLSGADLFLTDEAICLEWNRKVIARIAELQPAVVVTLLTTTRDKTHTGDIIPEGFRAAWAALPNVPILALRDNPRSNIDVVDCLERLGPDSPNCSFPNVTTLSPALEPASNLPENLFALDLTDALCTSETCSAVRDGVLVWRDRSHVTATYAQLLAPRFHKALAEMGLVTASDGL